MFLFFVITLPLLEIAGFIMIGGEIGVSMSLLWVIGSVIVGFSLLSSMGGQTLQKAQKSVDAEVYPFEEMFEGICILIGALLLIFPGFISDFLAIPLLVPFIRRGIFIFLKSQHKDVLDKFSRNAEGATFWYCEKRSGSEKRKGSTSKTIEGNFKHLEDKDENNK